MTDYREWMTAHGIDKFSQIDAASPFGDMIEFRAKRGEVTALYVVPRLELLDARYNAMAVVLAKLDEALNYGRPPNYMSPTRDVVAHGR